MRVPKHPKVAPSHKQSDQCYMKFVSGCSSTKQLSLDVRNILLHRFNLVTVFNAHGVLFLKKNSEYC